MQSSIRIGGIICFCTYRSENEVEEAEAVNPQMDGDHQAKAVPEGGGC